jgi:hypothetical protein
MAVQIYKVIRTWPSAIWIALICSAGFVAGMAVHRPDVTTVTNNIQPPKIEVKERAPVIQLRKLEKNLDIPVVK